MQYNANYRYSVLQVNDTSLDAKTNKKGLISYLLNGVNVLPYITEFIKIII